MYQESVYVDPVRKQRLSIVTEGALFERIDDYNERDGVGEGVEDDEMKSDGTVRPIFKRHASLAHHPSVSANKRVKDRHKFDDLTADVPSAFAGCTLRSHPSLRQPLMQNSMCCRSAFLCCHNLVIPSILMSRTHKNSNLRCQAAPIRTTLTCVLSSGTLAPSRPTPSRVLNHLCSTRGATSLIN